MPYLVGSISAVGAMIGKAQLTAAQALVRAADVRSVGTGEVTFTDVATGQRVTKAEVERVAQEEAGQAHRA